MNDLEVCWWPIDKPIPYARNSRKIPERAIDKVAASIKEFGFRVPIVVDKAFVIICGHTRLLAAKKLGLTEVPVHVASNLTPAQVKAYRLMDNRSHEETDWDLDLLGPELEELRGLDFDLELTGFDQHEIDDFLSDPGADDRANLVPPVNDNPVTQPNDVWLMGKHRLEAMRGTAPGMPPEVAAANYRAAKNGQTPLATVGPTYQAAARVSKAATLAQALSDSGVTYTRLANLPADQLKATVQAAGREVLGKDFSETSIEELMHEMARLGQKGKQ